MNRSFRECEQRYAKSKSKFEELKGQRLEMERRRRRNELIPEESRPMISGETQYVQERDTLDQSHNKMDQVIEVGSYALEHLRGQGKMMKV